ncbi:MAG: hypothetical protein J6C43_06970, partial [Oscillospiraceae bacterium]|nr:hypothetical protein [Oscillospiraceae bacterium]
KMTASQDAVIFYAFKRGGPAQSKPGGFPRARASPENSLYSSSPESSSKHCGIGKKYFFPLEIVLIIIIIIIRNIIRRIIRTEASYNGKPDDRMET